MPSNDWSSREPPSLDPARSAGPGAGADGFELHASHADRTLPPRPIAARAHYDEPRYEPRRRMGRKLVYAFLAVVALIAVALGALVVAPPVDLVRSHVAAEVERQTGRKLVIGSAGISLATGLGVSLGHVTLSAPPGMGGAPLLRSERIEVSLSLLPLLAGGIEIDRLTLVKPVLDLRVDREGRRSWQTAGAADLFAAPLRFAQASGTATDAAGMPPEVADFMRNASPPRRRGGNGLDALSLSDVRIVDGVLRYEDARSGFVRELAAVDATASLPNPAGRLSVNGKATVAGERVAVDLQIDSLREFLADRSVAMRAAIEGKNVEASFAGKIATGARPLSEGKLVAKSPSATRLAQVLGLPLAGLDLIGAVAVDGQLRATGNSVMLTSATFSAGPSSGTGMVGIESTGERPHVIANLRLDKVDLERVAAVSWDGGAVAPREQPAGPSPGRFAAPFALPAPAGGQPASIADLLKNEGADAPGSSPATRVKGFRQRLANEWDIDPYEVEALRAVDVEARVHIASLRTEKLSAENVQTGIELKGGVLRLTIAEGRIAGGTVRGLASIDARQPALTVGVNLAGENLAMKPLLSLAGVDLLDGRGRLIVTFSAQGSSERELVSTLSGRAEIKVADGALVGWDAESIVSDLGKGRMPESERRPTARTPFKQLAGNFHIGQGVARSRDLKLESHVVDATGTATVNIVDRNVDITLKPRVGTGGLEVPVRIAGAWNSPRLVADVGGALKSQQAQEAVRNLKEGNVDGALRSVLGNGPKAEKKIEKAKELLRGVLGR